MVFKDPEAKRAYNREWKKNRFSDPVLAAERNKKRKDKLKAYVDELKKAPCTDCGGTFHPVCMDFDHLGDKTHDIAFMVNKRHSMKRIIEEIKKCELVCANCHRLRTHNRSIS